MREYSPIRQARAFGWFLERFGIWPPRTLRKAAAGVPRVFCTSIPKSGTHLLERALCLHPSLYRKPIPTVNEQNLSRWNNLEELLSGLRAGQIIVSHLPFSPSYAEALNKAGVSGIFMYRDPRDVVISHVHHIASDRSHALHDHYRKLGSFDAQLMASITGLGDQRLDSIGARLSAYYGWLSSKLLAVRFEALIGAEGGGSHRERETSLQTIFDYFDLPIDQAILSRISGNLYSRASPTFRRGERGRWRSRFLPAHTEAFKAVAQSQLLEFGYETDDDW